jgi:hypothetical protein
VSFRRRRRSGEILHATRGRTRVNYGRNDGRGGSRRLRDGRRVRLGVCDRGRIGLGVGDGGMVRLGRRHGCGIGFCHVDGKVERCCGAHGNALDNRLVVGLHDVVVVRYVNIGDYGCRQDDGCGAVVCAHRIGADVCRYVRMRRE